MLSSISPNSSFRARQLAPVIILLLAIALVLLAFFGDESFRHLEALEAELEQQSSENQEVREYVDAMRRDVIGIQKDDRALEKIARNELGMVRENEVLYIFKDKKD